MYEYRFEKLDLKFFSTDPKRDYHEIIERYAKEGWRLVQIFAPVAMASGASKYFEIIFEREIDEK
jgi:hypothetical protein